MPSKPAPEATVILATANPHKVEELRAILAGSARVLSLSDLPPTIAQHLSEPPEPGKTFEANARLKALGYARQLLDRAANTAHPALLASAERTYLLADDSGLEIDALAGAPGVISSHYSTNGEETGLTRAERDAANNARVLRELEGVEPERRSARFVCVMALADLRPAPKVVFTARGTFEGRIGVPPRVPAGNQGFGYDPLFLVAPTFDRTSAELSSQEKNRLSHRARAAEQVVQWLQARSSLA